MTWQRIDQCFERLRAEKRTALVGFITTGDPSVEDSYLCARAVLQAGADILELGVPFSDPTADGPVIAQASYRAIQSGGSLRAALGVARRLREHSQAPIVLFTYYNPVLAYGEARLPAALLEAGVDALLVVDLPPEEGAELRAGCAQSELAVVPLLTPTSGAARERVALEGARGFIYYVSVTGVTGAQGASEQQSESALNALTQAGQAARALSERAGLPVVVGFGIDSPDKARRVADQGPSGVVVGTALVRAIAADPTQHGRVERVSALIRSLREALDA